MKNELNEETEYLERRLETRAAKPKKPSEDLSENNVSEDSTEATDLRGM